MKEQQQPEPGEISPSSKPHRNQYETASAVKGRRNNAVASECNEKKRERYITQKKRKVSTKKKEREMEAIYSLIRVPIQKRLDLLQIIHHRSAVEQGLQNQRVSSRVVRVIGQQG
jgi:hypothetical protein